MLPNVTYKLYFLMQYYMPEESYSGYCFTIQIEDYDPVEDIHKLFNQFAEGHTAPVKITLFCRLTGLSLKFQVAG